MDTRRSAGVIAAVAFAAVTAPSRPVHAQPVCTTGTVADYVALVGGCQLGGVTFTGFQGTFTGVTSPLSSVTVMPVSSPGQVGFGLALGSPLSVLSNNGSFITPAAMASFAFDFMASGAGSGAQFGVSPFSLFTASVSAAPGGGNNLSARAAIIAISQGANAHVIVETRQAGGSPATSDCVVGAPDGVDVPCAPLVTTDFADGPVQLTGSVIAFGNAAFPSSASLQNLSIVILPGTNAPTVTPEPAPMPLVAAGVALLALAGWWRRVASPGEPV